jgi:fermentation-respiration switch protein FrsA (DUF1100 family)
MIINKPPLFLFFRIIVISLMLTSCAFNKLFLQPTKISASVKKLMMKSADDSVLVIFSGLNHQPVFIRNGKDTLEQNFTIESILFENSDGAELNGWLLKPKNSLPTTTLLHLHGNAGCLLSQFKAISPMAENGFQIFTFDYSGFGFSQGNASRKNVLKDANAALDYIKSRTDIKDTKIVLYGQSLGGHLAAVVAEERENDIDGLVTEGAFSSHKDIGGHMVPFLGKLFVKQGYSALKSIKTYNKPLLVIHSTEDKTIPFFMGQKIYAAANNPKLFYEVKKCHICAPQFYADSIAIKIKNMIEIK